MCLILIPVLIVGNELFTKLLQEDAAGTAVLLLSAQQMAALAEKDVTAIFADVTKFFTGNAVHAVQKKASPKRRCS